MGQLTIKEYYDPFMGEPANKSKYKQPHFVGLLVARGGRKIVSPRLEARLVSRPYRASAGRPFYRWSRLGGSAVPNVPPCIPNGSMVK